jgi:choline dehydrogenase-like flavoprotein
MHHDPNHGVVDEDGRVHGIPNLFVSGSSVFPTGGYANPTLTIVALALRLADRLRRELAPVRIDRAGEAGTANDGLDAPASRLADRSEVGR